MTPEEMMKRLMEIFSSQSSSSKHTSQNPAKYPRAIKLDPNKATSEEQREQMDKMLMLLTEIEMKARDVSELGEQAAIKIGEGELARNRFFQLARQSFPNVITKQRREEGSGWREWKGDFYIVAWDKEEEDGASSDDSGKEEGYGNYI